MLEIVIKGGPVMVPILFCSVLALGVSLERLWYFFVKTRVDAEDLMDEVKLALGQGKVLEALQITRRAHGPLASVLATGIANYDKEPEVVRSFIDETGRHEVRKLEKRLPILDSIVTISPLLGLLGTVTGIIKSFRVFAALEGISQPSTLSVGIAEALITTAAGLIVAIPAMAIYNWLNAIVDRRVDEMNKHATELIEALKVEVSTR